LGWNIGVIGVNYIFYCVRSKNDIIGIKQNNGKKKINGRWHGSSLVNHLIFYLAKK